MLTYSQVPTLQSNTLKSTMSTVTIHRFPNYNANQWQCIQVNNLSTTNNHTMIETMIETESVGTNKKIWFKCLNTKEIQFNSLI